MVYGSDASLKIKGWVPMSLKPLLMRSSKTTTSYGCMITKTKTQVLSPESCHDDDRPHDDDDDVTSTDASEEDDVSMRKSYLEALLQ
jgi:hypothetical protein